MLSDVLMACVVLIAMVAFAWRVVAPVGAIWRGDATRVPHLIRLRPQARTYLTFSLWITMLCVGVCLICIYGLMQALGTHGSRMVAGFGIGAMSASIALMLVNVIVWAFNRPKLLVVPAYRNHPGSLAMIRERMRRGRLPDRDGDNETATTRDSATKPDAPSADSRATRHVRP